MQADAHNHPVDAAGVTKAHQAVLPATDAEQLGALLGLMSDPVRLRMLFVLVSVDELCVGDLGLALGISMDQSSYALKQLRAAGLVQPRRDGRVIYYRLADDFPRPLLEHCLRQLLALSNRQEES